MFEYQTMLLDSGLRIVHQHNDSHVGYCGFVVDCGTRSESCPAEFGMAHFIEHILFKGTHSRDAWHINQRMESVGGELNAFTTKEDTTFYSSFLAQDFDRACELLCDLLCHATAPQHELEKEQDVVVEEIDSYRDTPSELIYDEFENRLFANHPLGHNTLGSADTVRSFDSRRCLDFLSRNYSPERMVFFAYGPMRWSHVVKAVSKWFDKQPVGIPSGIYRNGVPVVPLNIGNPDADNAGCLHVVKADCHQSHVIIGARTYPIGHKNATALALINNLLGGPGMNSRLNQQLREKRGLVYTVESNVSAFTDTGYFSIYFGCDHADRDRCVRICKRELKRLIDIRLTPRQVQAAQKQLKGQLALSTANLENNALALGKNILRKGRLESLEETCSRIDSVTPEQIQQVASVLFDESHLMTVVLE